MNKHRAEYLKEIALTMSIKKYELLVTGTSYEDIGDLFREKHLPILENIAGKKFPAPEEYSNCACCAVSDLLTENTTCEECIIYESIRAGVVESLSKSGCLKSYYNKDYDKNEKILRDLRFVENWYYNERGKK